MASKTSKDLTQLLGERSSIQLKLGRLERNISNAETRQQSLEARNDVLRQELVDIRRSIVDGDDALHRLLKVCVSGLFRLPFVSGFD